VLFSIGGVLGYPCGLGDWLRAGVNGSHKPSVMDEFNDDDLLLCLEAAEGESRPVSCTCSDLTLPIVANTDNHLTPSAHNAEVGAGPEQSTATPAQPLPLQPTALAAGVPMESSITGQKRPRTTYEGRAAPTRTDTFESRSSVLGPHGTVQRPTGGQADAADGVEEFSKLRIVKRTVPAAEVRMALAGRSVHRIKQLADGPQAKYQPKAGADGRAAVDWITIGVLASKSPPQTGKTGAPYAIWRLSDFSADVSVFLFGEAYETCKREVRATPHPSDGCAACPWRLS